jgi:hypothetical protein
MKDGGRLMRRVFLPAIALGLSLCGCADGLGTGYAKVALSDSPSEAADGDRQYLERKHALTVDVPESQIEAAFHAVVAACNDDRTLQCTVLDSELTKAESTTASISARLSPIGVEPFIALAAKHGRVESRSTHTNDLAKPIIDAEQRLKMLDAYMADLLRLRQQSRNDVDALIKVTSEIAETQAKIESLKGEHTHLLQRVDFQVVGLHFFSDRTQSFAAPITRALRDFGRDLTSGIAQAITGFAYLVPWLVILVPLAFLFRYLWRRFR